MVTEALPILPYLSWGGEEGNPPVCEGRCHAQVRRLGRERDTPSPPEAEADRSRENPRKPQGGRQMHTQGKKLLHTLGGKRQTGQRRGRAVKESH